MTVRFMACLIAGFLLAWGLVATPEARGAEPIRTVPLVQRSTDLGVHTIIIEAPPKAFGLRRLAATVDRNINGLDIWARRGVSCMPTVTCVRVSVGWYGAFPAQTCTGRLGESWAGCAQLGGTDPYIWLNTYFRGSLRSVVCHEFMHALGLDHHDGLGCVGTASTTVPSDQEMDVLRGLYP